MGTVVWGPELAEVFDETYAAQYAPAVLDPMVDLLAGLAGGGPALELAVGTGRVALALSARGVPMEPDHVGIETFDDTVGQIAWSHHWMQAGGRLVHHAAPYRYVWPAELDLMARLAGLQLRDRWGGWDRAPFTSASESQVAVFEKPMGSKPAGQRASRRPSISWPGTGTASAVPGSL